MLVIALLLSQAAVPAATPTPTPRPAAVLGRTGAPARTKTLSEHANEMKARGKSTRSVSFDDVRTVEPGEEPTTPAAGAEEGRGPVRSRAASGPGGEAAAAKAAQRRMDRAVERGLAVPERTRSSSRDRARQEWDEAAEACRTTPGCVPAFRDDPRFGEAKPLKTDQELIDDIRKRGFSEPHPMPKRD